MIAKFEQTEGVFEKLHKTINRTPFLSHLQKIKKTFVWCTNVEVMAIASLFQIDVYVATESHNPTWLRYTPRTAVTSAQTTSKLLFDISPHLQPQKEWIEIAHVCGSHFDSIKPLLLGVKLVHVRPPFPTTSSFLDLSD